MIRDKLRWLTRGVPWRGDFIMSNSNCKYTWKGGAIGVVKTRWLDNTLGFVVVEHISYVGIHEKFNIFEGTWTYRNKEVGIMNRKEAMMELL